MNTQRAAACAKEMGNWSFDAMFICFRDNFSCVYCEINLLEDRGFPDGDIFKYFSHFDHLLPKSKYPELEEEKSNKVLSCMPCNRRKRSWDPNEKDPSYPSGSGRALGDEERQRFIDLTKKWLEPLSQKDRAQFSKLKKLINGA